LGKLFANFPVRRQQIQNSIKKEFAKAEQVLTAYALICTGVRYDRCGSSLLLIDDWDKLCITGVLCRVYVWLHV
jgi:hypothetical protein